MNVFFGYCPSFVLSLLILLPPTRVCILFSYIYTAFELFQHLVLKNNFIWQVQIFILIKGEVGVSVSVVTRLWVGWPGFYSQHGQERLLFSLHYHVHTSLGIHPASCPLGTRCSSSRVKWPECEADHSSTMNAEDKMYMPSYHGA